MSLTKEQLKALSDNLNHQVHHRFESMNFGGCGFFASVLGIYLQKSNVEFELYFAEASYYDEETLEGLFAKYGILSKCVNDLILEIEHRLVEDVDFDWEEGYQDVPNGHVLVKIGDQLYDARGNVTKRYNTIGNAIRPDVLETIVMRKEYWNPDFRYAHSEELQNIRAHTKLALNEALAV